MSTGKVLLGALAGFAMGAIAGILFAPEKGSKTRKRIMDKSGDYADEIKSKFNEMLVTIEEKMEVLKHDAKKLADDGIEKFDVAKRDAKITAIDSMNNAESEIKRVIS